MTSVTCDLDTLRTTFPAWAVFRSDAGVFYGTRRGETLTNSQVEAGLLQTVCADDLSTFIVLLREQDARR
ncbi:hypothetical protein ACFV0L_37130 [Streptosporangium canum]|uniref:hypothetical protein n=1 Tax=Streptosporangium canum TaxID=324952 RepID=UPI003693D95A